MLPWSRAPLYVSFALPCQLVSGAGPLNRTRPAATSISMVSANARRFPPRKPKDREPSVPAGRLGVGVGVGVGDGRYDCASADVYQDARSLVSVANCKFAV